MKKLIKKKVIAGSIIVSLVGGGAVVVGIEHEVSAASKQMTTVHYQQSENRFEYVSQSFSNSLLALLKLDIASLKDKLANGQSLAQIANQQGVSREALKTELIKQANETLNKEKNDFISNIDTMIDSTTLGKRIKTHHKSGHSINSSGKHKKDQVNLVPIATLLGYKTEIELKNILQSGKSLAEIATIQKVDVQKIKDEIKKQIQSDLDKKLKEASITQTKYNERINRLANQIDHIINHKHQVKIKNGNNLK